MVKAIVGANWGDEGKGKITDLEAAKSDIVVRYQGGSNAGHTIVNSYGKFALHQLPSGVFHGHITNIIGNGVALDVEKFSAEIQTLLSKGVPMPSILVSDRVQLVMPYHILLDSLEEARLSERSFGSTKSGIAPFYADKYAKTGFQLSELYGEESYIKAKISQVLATKNTLLKHLYNQPELSADELFATLMRYKEMLSPYKADVLPLLHKAVKEGKKILLEGQLGALKDPDFGIYPMVTSSSPLAAYGALGAGVPPQSITDIIAVVKAYSSAVGAGEFVSELHGEQEEELRKRGGDGGEYGATTGRPRRVGWLDLVATRYGCMVQSATEVAFSVIDVLGYLDELPVCVAYELDGKRITHFPSTVELARCTPIYEVLPGWKCEIRGIKKYEDLPENCRNYIEFAEKFVGIPFTLISNGPARDDIIYREV